MSMPSSRLEVATRHGIRPALSSSSISTRCSRASEPWWARAISCSASSLRRIASRSARRRLLTNTIVERCAGRARGWPGRSTARSSVPSPRSPGPISTPSGSTGWLELAVRTELAEVLDRDHDLEIELLAVPASTSCDLAARAGDEPPDLLERSLCGREADALEGSRDDSLEPLQRERQVRAALRAGDRVHLVEDHRLDRAEHLPPLRGEEQEQRLGGRDEDVGWCAQHLLPFPLRRVARAHADGERRAEAGERPAQVALDVVVERLERRDVEQPQPFARGVVEPVETEQEGGERLARAGRRLHEHVPPARDRRPGLLLRGGRAGEGTLEPGASRRRERVERGPSAERSARSRQAVSARPTGRGTERRHARTWPVSRVTTTSPWTSAVAASRPSTTGRRAPALRRPQASATDDVDGEDPVPEPVDHRDRATARARWPASVAWTRAALSPVGSRRRTSTLT